MREELLSLFWRFFTGFPGLRDFFTPFFGLVRFFLATCANRRPRRMIVVLNKLNCGKVMHHYKQLCVRSISISRSWYVRKWGYVTWKQFSRYSTTRTTLEFESQPLTNRVQSTRSWSRKSKSEIFCAKEYLSRCFSFFWPLAFRCCYFATKQ